MALRGTLTHRKIRRLAMLLHISPCFALGVVESLWHVTAEQTPAGDIGKMADEDIAMEMFYDGDASALVEALISANLLERSVTHRLIVHDWHAHSDDATDNKLARSGIRYANGESPRMKRLSKQERAKAEERFDQTSPRNGNHNVSTESHDVVHSGATNHFQSQSPEPRPAAGVQSRSPEPGEKRPPQDSDAGIAPEMVARAVMEELGLGGRFLLNSLIDVIRAELKHGGNPDRLRDAMITARRAYERDVGRLRRPSSPRISLQLVTGAIRRHGRRETACSHAARQKQRECQPSGSKSADDA
jgi:hypothetical protein